MSIRADYYRGDTLYIYEDQEDAPALATIEADLPDSDALDRAIEEAGFVRAPRQKWKRGIPGVPTTVKVVAR